MRSSVKGESRLSSGWVVGLGVAVFTCVTAAAATSDVGVAAVEAVIETLVGTPPPATPPSPTLPAGTPVAERRVFLKPPGDDAKLDPQAPKPLKPLVEPVKVPVMADGVLPERARAGRDDPAMCSAQCQLEINSGLKGCEGNLEPAAAERGGSAVPVPNCRKTLVVAYSACMATCGLALPDPKAATAVVAPESMGVRP